MKGIFKKWILGFAFVLPACTEVEELEVPKHAPLLVVNSVVNQEDDWRVQVSLSKELNNDNFYPLIDDARVEVYQNGQLLEQLESEGKGIYTSGNIQPIAETEYTLRVGKSGFTETNASIKFPKAPEVSIRSISYVKDSENKTINGKWVQVTCTIADDPAKEDFYFIRTYSVDSAYSFDLDKVVYFNTYRSLNFPVPITISGFDGMELFTDRTFQGQEHSMIFNVEYYGGLETFIQIGKVTPAFYEYNRTYRGQVNYQEKPFAQPTPVSSNVEGGLGIFAGYNFRNFVLKDG